MIRVFCLTTIMFWQLQIAVFAYDDNSNSAATKKSMLKGGIEHSEKLAPLDPNLKVGAHFDIVKLKKLTPNNRWSKLPDWMVGTWKTKTNTTYYVYDYLTDYKSFDVNTFGCRGRETDLNPKKPST